MALIKPFRALRPRRELAARVAALPYDVMNREEACSMAAGNPHSFLHISRPEIDLPADLDPHQEPVYQQGRVNLQRMIDEAVLCQDERELYYIYRQRMGAIVQTGLVACASVDDYQNGTIKKHELTRHDKEEDRVRHIDSLDANDEPVFYTYRKSDDVQRLIAMVVAGEPEYDFTTDDGVSHTLWVVDDTGIIQRLTDLFADIAPLYVADGHHRSAAASRVREMRRTARAEMLSDAEYNFFLTVIFPDDELNIMPYNRVVKDLAGLSTEQFLKRVTDTCTLEPVDGAPEVGLHQFGLYLAGRWYVLSAQPGTFRADDPVQRLDVSILQNNLLAPILGVQNPRSDQRIHFVGGIRGTAELQRLVDSGEFAVAFTLHPTSIAELMDLADAGEIMPPKSTWFEPKLRSGLFVHLLD